MPLVRTLPSASRKARNKIRSNNIQELEDKYDATGTIGTSHPADRAAAIRQAVAISYAQERRGKRKRRK